MKWSDLLLPSPKYATHNLDKKWEGSMSPGILYPIYHKLMLPGDTFKFNIRHLLRTNPTKAPLFSSFKVRVVTIVSNVKNYAIALEGYQRKFDWRTVKLPYFWWQFPDVGANGRPASDTYPAHILPAMGVKETSLADYLGYPRGWIPTSQQYRGTAVTSGWYADAKSALAFLTYYDFYRNYMINPQVSDFPIFTPNQSVAGHIGESYITTASISDLDDFFEAVHKYYDGVNADSINSGSTLSTLYNNVFGRNTYDPNQYTGSSKYKHPWSVYHGGLCPTLYDPDMNTQWMSVNNYNKLQEGARINTQTTTGTASQTYTNFSDIIKASSIYQFLVGEVYGDGTYANHIYSQYGVSVKADMNIPQVVHVMDSMLGFEDITSQSDTQQNAGTKDESGAPVGQQFGVGRSYGQSNSFTVRNTDKNMAMVMVLAWITPKVRYATGINPLENITRLSDIYVPAFDNYALQSLRYEQLNAVPRSYGDYMNATDDEPNTYDLFTSANGTLASAKVGYQPAFTEYKSDVDTVHGLFKSGLSYWTIVRNFPHLDAENVGFLDAGYVYDPVIDSYTPEKDALTYNVPFSVTNEDNIQAQFKFDITAIRPISKSVLPHVR